VDILTPYSADMFAWSWPSLL